MLLFQSTKQYVTFNYCEKCHIFVCHSDLPHEKTRSISPARKLPLGSRARSREIKISKNHARSRSETRIGAASPNDFNSHNSNPIYVYYYLLNVTSIFGNKVGHLFLLMTLCEKNA